MPYVVRTPCHCIGCEYYKTVVLEVLELSLQSWILFQMVTCRIAGTATAKLGSQRTHLCKMCKVGPCIFIINYGAISALEVRLQISKQWSLLGNLNRMQ